MFFYKKMRDWWYDQWGFPDYWDYEMICQSANKKSTRFGFFCYKVSGLLWYCFSQRWRMLLCKKFGHKVVDVSSGTPDSGNMDHECERCGEYWHVPLY